MEFADRQVHQQVVEAEDENHTVEDAEEEVFVEGIVEEPVNRAEDDDDVGALAGFYAEVEGTDTLRVVVETDDEVFMPEGAFAEYVAITEGSVSVVAAAVGGEEFDGVDGLVEEFEYPLFGRAVVEADGYAVPVGGLFVKVGGIEGSAGFEAAVACLGADVLYGEGVCWVFHVLDFVEGEDVLV